MNWYEGIFGNEIWKRVIIEVSFWGHAEEHVEERKGKKYVSRSCYKKKKVFLLIHTLAHESRNHQIPNVKYSCSSTNFWHP